jgi:hypothetical protein
MIKKTLLTAICLNLISFVVIFGMKANHAENGTKDRFLINQITMNFTLPLTEYATVRSFAKQEDLMPDTSMFLLKLPKKANLDFLDSNCEVLEFEYAPDHMDLAIMSRAKPYRICRKNQKKLLERDMRERFKTSKVFASWNVSKLHLDRYYNVKLVKVKYGKERDGKVRSKFTLFIDKSAVIKKITPPLVSTVSLEKIIEEVRDEILGKGGQIFFEYYSGFNYIKSYFIGYNPKPK